MFAACREIMYSAGRPLLQRAQADGQARPDVSFEDVLRLISGISGSAYSDDEQRERVLTMALDGIRHGPEADPLGRSEPCPWERVLSSTLPYREATRGAQRLVVPHRGCRGLTEPNLNFLAEQYVRTSPRVPQDDPPDRCPP